MFGDPHTGQPVYFTNTIVAVLQLPQVYLSVLIKLLDQLFSILLKLC